MIIICSWCKTFLGIKAPLNDDSVSNGMCEGCKAKFLEEIRKKEGAIRKYKKEIDEPPGYK